MPRRLWLLVASALLAGTVGCSSTTPPAPTESPRIAVELTQDSRDAAADRIAAVVANEGAAALVPESIEYLDPRLRGPLSGGRLRPVPAGGQRRFPLPLVDPVCGAPADSPGRLVVLAGSGGTSVVARDEVGVVARWVERRCAELEVAAVAPLELTAVRVHADGGSADLVLTARPTGAGSTAYVIESVAGTPVFTSTGEPWTPGVRVTAAGEPVEVLLPARPARCDGHVFGESAGATAFLVGVRIEGERREVLVRMAPSVAAEALTFAVDACRAQGGTG